MKRKYYLYILECSDKSFYTWITNNIEKRLDEHLRSEDIKSYLFLRKPLKLVHLEEYQDVTNAIQREKQIKWWSRAKKIAIINQNFNLLTKLS